MGQLKSSGIKIREFPESNYRSIFINNKTIRQAIDPNKPITELKWPAYYDVSPGNRCLGNCPWCYASASKSGTYYTNLAEKIYKFFGSMTENQRCDSVAIGGQMDSLEHPEAKEMLKAFHDLNITPNCTTNGIFVNEENINLIKSYGGAIAVSCYRHTIKHWERAIEVIKEQKMQFNLHCIISDKESINWTEHIYNKYKDYLAYMVILPYMNVGFGAKHPKKVDWNYFEKFLDKYHQSGQIAIGANGWNFLVKNSTKYNIPIFDPELFSKYICLDDNLSTYNNSFDMKPVPFIPGEGFELGHARTDFPACD